jgi:formate C-acetyltransferase
MFLTLSQDRPFLENKYHRTNEPFDPFRRMAYHGHDYDPNTGLDDDGIRQGLQQLSETCRGLPHPVAKARAVAYVLDNTRIDVSEHDYFIGLYSWGRLIAPTTLTAWHREVFAEHLPGLQDRLSQYKQSGAFTAWADYDHAVPDWQALFELGFSGILDRARRYRRAHEAKAPLTPEQTAFFDAIAIEYEAILRLLDRLEQYAQSRPHAKAAKVAACLHRLRDGAPQNTYDVLQLIYLFFMICECVEHYQVRSLASGFDVMLYPYYRRDLEQQTFSQEELNDLIGCFLMQFSAIGNYWGHPLYIGGTDEAGASLVNPLSYAILDIYDTLGIYNPKIQVKVNRNTPDAFVVKILDMIRRGHNSLVFVCEPGLVRSMMSLGVTYTEARTCDIKGCYEFSVRAGEVSTAPLYLNLLKPICLVLQNGRDRLTGAQIGLTTGELEDLRTFDDFYAAYLRQLAFILETGMQAADAFERYLDVINPAPMFSATIEHSLQVMRDAYATGSKYNNTVVLHTGFASAVDSLMVVKYLVYDSAALSLIELKTALDQDWNGYERLRAQALNCPHKYGNQDQLADLYATALSRWLCNMRPNARGGVYKAAIHSARMFIDFGQTTEATPDGRKLGEELSKNASPVIGMDTRGVTALVQSATQLDPTTYTEDFNLDVMLHPSAVQGEEGLKAMKAILDTYMQQYGLAIQFNVFDSQTLRDAQINPERYKNLQVRVCGWNVLWNNLSRAEQDAYILRSERIAR